MQGKLSEIDIRSILQLIELGQRTGELFVESYSTPVSFGIGDRLTRGVVNQSWFAFFLNGQLIYAGDSGNNLSRLRDYLRRYKLESALNNISGSSVSTVNAPEYGHLWMLIEQHILTPSQGRSIVQAMIHETLFDLLSLHQGAFVFELNSPLAPQLTTLEVGPLVVKIMKQVQEWKQLQPHIQSPEQLPAIADPDELKNLLPGATFTTLTHWIDGQTSIRQMSRYLNRDILTFAKAIYPYVQQGLIQLSPAPSMDHALSRREWLLPEENRVPRIICIDDGQTIRKAVEFILNEYGYEATAIGNPLKALSLVFHLKPDLILCDIAMPDLDGYEICAMLRRSTAFRQTPIIMLTGKEGFIDRLRARMVGATDYLTKPFGENELLMLVEKYVGKGFPDRPNPDKLLAQAVEDELEIDITESAST
jgi:twitching motility two-component system response regulator PilG